MGVLASLSQVGVISMIAFFLLASGDQFRRKLVKLAGPRLGQKKITLQAMNQIHDQIQRYMLVQLVTSVLVGVGLAVGLMGAATGRADFGGDQGSVCPCGRLQTGCRIFGRLILVSNDAHQKRITDRAFIRKSLGVTTIT
jgi:hypothetical protein